MEKVIDCSTMSVFCNVPIRIFNVSLMLLTQMKLTLIASKYPTKLIHRLFSVPFIGFLFSFFHGITVQKVFEKC